MAFGFVLTEVPGATPKKPNSGLPELHELYCHRRLRPSACASIANGSGMFLRAGFSAPDLKRVPYFKRKSVQSAKIPAL
jgi:hypothetical protein